MKRVQTLVQRVALLCALALSAWPGWSAAQTDAVTVAFLQGKAPVAPDAVATLGPDLFGDKLNLYNGSVEFEQVDVSIPGNSALPVALTRQYAPRLWTVRGAMADWDVSTPRIQGTFSTSAGWIAEYGSPATRCSQFGAPPTMTALGADFAPWEYWQGTHLVIPGQGAQEVLKRSPSFATQPADGGTYPLLTKNLWQIGCLPGLQNAPGQGFFAVSPEGVRYRFDWMASRSQSATKKGDATLPRRDMFLMATSVTDRFGNWVHYSYDPANPMNLLRIDGSDGRAIVLSYTNGRVSSVTDGSRVWNYVYAPNGDLLQVVLPDNSRWTFNLRPMVYPDSQVFDEYVDCDSLGASPGGLYIGNMTHPSGANGKFVTAFLPHGRTDVQRACTYIPGTTWTNGAMWPKSLSNQALVSKEISGPGMATMAWSYSGDSNSPYGEWAPCNNCLDRKTVSVTEPGGAVTRHTFGIRWRVNEGQLLKTEEGWDANSGTALRTTVFNYRAGGAPQAFVDAFGTSIYFHNDYVSTLNRPQDLKVVTQQNVDFTWRAEPTPAGFDTLARPVRTQSFSSLGYSRGEWTEYYDSPALWVLGQPSRVTETTSGREVERHTYYPATALRQDSYAFGRFSGSRDYYADGTLAALYDGARKLTRFENFYRGLPQRAVFADQTAANHVVTNIGNVASITNEAGTTTSFAFDAMGRVSTVFHPSGDATAYNPTQLGFTQVGISEWGLPAGHWTQTVNTGNGFTKRWFDALWRVRVQQTYDAANPAATSSYVETRYDAAGRKAFESYPSASFSGVDVYRLGVMTEYDKLNRVIRRTADSELGPLVTSYDYLPGFQRRTTNPRQFATTHAFQAFDKPEEDRITGIWASEGVTVSIDRDVFGKANFITRSGSSGESATRRYVYDNGQRLCKTIEPESGATAQDYDDAGNVVWRASGLSLPGTVCDGGSVPATRRVTFGYDLRNRLTSTSYGDGNGTLSRTYTPDGLLASATSARPGVNTITWTYGYNNRRLPLTERYEWGDPNSNWTFAWSWDANGHASTFSDPWGTLAYSPDSLGRPTQVGSYANSLSYHPNGQVAGYTLANGVAFTLAQNARGLPSNWQHTRLSTGMGVAQYSYAYDPNGNVNTITDQINSAYSRSMPWYDGLDRLRQANGPWGAGSFTYDGLDNITTSSIGSRTLQHQIDPATNKLTALTGSQNVPFSYDANGNITNRAGQGFVFDVGNRLLQAVSKASYAYDGHGRRNMTWFADGTYRHDAYTRDGKVRLIWKLGQGGTRYVYLGDRLIAETLENGTTTYVHTDALGSPVAKTSQAGAVVEETRYEPYGGTLAGSTNPTRIGFTGHVNDPDTGLVYMQQRYYEPLAGRFLSVDPITTDAKTGGHFNRYDYANNNSYAFIDPDGRSPVTCTGTNIAAACGIGYNTLPIENSPPHRPLTGGGHHTVPNQTIKALGITSAPALKVFDSADARIPVENHNGARPSSNTVSHDEYNRLATKEARQFMDANKIDPTKMTGEQARAMLNHFKTGADPQIRQFNQVQFSRALQQAIHRAWYKAPIKTEE